MVGSFEKETSFQDEKKNSPTFDTRVVSWKPEAAAVEAAPVWKLCLFRELYGRPTWRAASLRRLTMADLQPWSKLLGH